MKNALQTLSAENKTMSTREIADLTGKRHDNVMTDCNNLLEYYQSIYSPEKSGEFIKSDTYKDASGKSNKCYKLSKDAALDLVTGYSLPHRHAVNQRWQELESQQLLQLPNFNNPVEAARAWANEAEQKQLAKAERDQAFLQIEADAPKVQFATIVSEDSNTRCVRVWVKAMKHENNLTVGEREVFKWLLDNRYIFKDSGGYLPYSRYEANGSNYFTVVIDDINGKPRRQLKITGKGVVALTGKVVSCFAPKRNGLVLLQGGAL